MSSTTFSDDCAGILTQSNEFQRRLESLVRQHFGTEVDFTLFLTPRQTDGDDQAYAYVTSIDDHADFCQQVDAVAYEILSPLFEDTEPEVRTTTVPRRLN